MEDKDFNSMVEFIEKHRLGRKLTEDEKLVAEKAYFIGKQHQFNAMIDSIKEVY